MSAVSNLKVIIGDKEFQLTYCKTKFPELFDDGVLVFNDETQSLGPSIYDSIDGDELSKKSGSIGHDQESQLLYMSKEFGWENAIKKYYHDNQDAVVRNFSKNRINWLSYVDAGEDKDLALEIGPGTGGVTRQLSSYYDVIALDRSIDNCKFINECAIQSNLPIQAICKQTTPLPFADNQFDLIAMIGSVEWLPFYSSIKNPVDVVNEYLRECFRVLKPGGAIYIASENASFLQYYFGMREAHTMLSYVSLLDQESADQVSLHYSGKPFRTPTYNPDQLGLMLSDAGFKNTSSYWLYPDYSTPAYIIPLDCPKNVMRYFTSQRLNPWDFVGEREALYRFFRLLDPKLFKTFVEHYAVIASK